MAICSRRKQKWIELTESNNSINTKQYSLEDSFLKGDFIEHKMFGTGYVKSIHANKIKVLFEDKNRVLIHKVII